MLTVEIICHTKFSIFISVHISKQATYTLINKQNEGCIVMKNRFQKKKSDSQPTLSDIVRGIQFCVNSSIEILERHFITQVDKYLDEDNKALTKTIKINDKYAVDVPLFCMSDHNALILQEMEVRMNVNLKDFEIKELKQIDNENDNEFAVTRSSFRVDAANCSVNNSNNIDICMKFKSGDPPEAISRISEKLTNAINIYCTENKID